MSGLAGPRRWSAIAQEQALGWVQLLDRSTSLHLTRPSERWLGVSFVVVESGSVAVAATKPLALPSLYANSRLKRFGDYPNYLKPEATPTRTTLPL
jgi:hypothetical protein